MKGLRKVLGSIKEVLRAGKGSLRALHRGNAAPVAFDPALAQEDPKLPPWMRLIEADRGFWQQAVARARGGPKVLIANNVPGLYNSTILESLLAAALTLRGAEVHVLLCDQVLPACQKLKFGKSPPGQVIDGSFRRAVCDGCVRLGGAFAGLGIPVHRYSSFLGKDDREEIDRLAASLPPEEVPSFRSGGLALGEHAYAGCLRYYSTGNLVGQRRPGEVLGRYFQAALLAERVLGNLLRAHPFEAACFHHGIYIPQGIVGEFCRARGIRAVTWNVAYRKRCFIFSHGDTYHHTLLDEPLSAWKGMAFSDEEDREIGAYLQSRWKGSQDWIYFHDTPDDRMETLLRETGLDPAKPIIGLLTNVMWDAQLHYRANAFPDMLDWILKTIRWFAGRPDLQLLIRVHPAESRGLQKSRQFVADEVRKVFDPLPPNVFIIPPDSNVNTYAAMQRANCVIIYGTKTGVELASMGVPVIVAGEAWIRNKGLTTDVSSEEEYFRILGGLPLKDSRMPPEMVREARKYAYHFFLRRMIPVAAIGPVDDVVPYRVSVASLRDLLPGRDEGLDVICEGILKGSPFIHRREEKQRHGAP